MSTTNRPSIKHIIDASGFFCALGYATLAYLARQTGEPGLLSFYGILVWTATPVFILYLYLVRRDVSLPIGRLFLWAIVFRLCGLFGGPFYEDDFFRYLWDGYRFWVAGTPYGVAPEMYFLDSSVPAALQASLNQINHPDMTTIYGPMTQLLFLLGFLIKAGSVSVLQALLISVDLATLYLITRLTSARNAMLYAWCPLVIKEIAFSAHPDGIGICLALAAIVLTMKKRTELAAVCLGLAVGAKIFALALVPFILRRAPVQYWLYFVGTLALLYTPFVWMGASDLEMLVLFVQEWEFNASIYALLAALIAETPAKITLAALCGALFCWYLVRYSREDTNVPRGDWIFGVLFIASPVFNAWYMLWVLPFAAIYPSRWAWTASIVLLLTYITGLNLNDFTTQAYAQPIWVKIAEFCAIAIALCWDILRHNSEVPQPRW